MKIEPVARFECSRCGKELTIRQGKPQYSMRMFIVEPCRKCLKEKETKVMLAAADEIERWKKNFENLQAWCDKNGWDTATRNR